MEAARQRSSISIEWVEGRVAFTALKSDWDVLADRVNAEIFESHEFLRSWVENFGPEKRLQILTARENSGELLAALPLLRGQTRVVGIPLVELSAPVNSHSCRFDAIGENQPGLWDAIFGKIAEDASWGVLRLRDIPLNGKAWLLAESARAAGFAVGRVETCDSPFLDLPDSYQALEGKLDAKFRANLRRRKKRLQERGQVVVERWTNGSNLEEKLEEGFRLEWSGWKGRAGTAIVQDSQTRGFYRELARNAMYRNQLALYFLRLDGRAIAFHFGLVHRARYLLLKPAYDEALKECGPGQLLTSEVIKDCIQRKFRVFDFLGYSMPWKSDWMPDLRPQATLFIFQRSRLGRALHRAKFEWSPIAKKALRKWKS